MRLFSKTEALKERKKQTEEILGRNQRLLNFFDKGLKKLNNLKDNYDQDKVRKQQEFDNFCQQLNLKRSDLLKELMAIERQIREKREILYEIIERQDKLDEKQFEVEEREKKVSLRESFASGIERKLQKLTSSNGS